MEHVVFYTGPDSAPQFRRVPSLDEAVRYVESLRNGEGVDDSVVFAMTEVPLRFQTYYRVELPSEGSAAPAAEPAPAVEGSPAVDPAPLADPAPVDVLAEPAAAPTPLEPIAFEPIVVAEPVVAEAASTETAVTESGPAVAVVPEPAPEPVAEVTLAPEMPTIEAITPAPLLPDAATTAEEAEPSANGKPNRGMGFFAR